MDYGPPVDGKALLEIIGGLESVHKMNDEAAQRDTIYCFLDTNFLLHFQTFDEVDWPAILHATEVYLVLAPIVVREIDRYKDDSTNEWRQQRARTLLTKLKGVLRGVPPGQPTPLRTHSYVLDLPNEPVVDWANLRLDPLINDDRLLATMVEFRDENPAAKILLLTHDFPIQRKAATQGLEVREAEGLIPMLERPSTGRKAPDAERRRPKLEFGFWENNTIVGLVTATAPSQPTEVPSDAQILQEVEQQRSELNQLIAWARRNVGRRRDQVYGTSSIPYIPSISRIRSVPLPEEIERYERVIEKHLRELESALRMQRTRNFGIACSLQFALRNSGGSTATDVTVKLQLPAEAVIIDDPLTDFFGGDGFLPNIPDPEWDRDITAAIVAHTPIGRMELPRPMGPLYTLFDQSNISYTNPKVQVGEPWLMRGFTLYIPPNIQGGFSIPYSLQWDEPPLTRGELHIRIK